MTSDSIFRNRYGSWAVVTGASDGIGREFARELARRGMNLVLVARREAALRELADELARQHGVQCAALAADLSISQGRRRVTDAASSLDVGLLVAAAGFGSSGEFIGSSLDTERDMLAVNCDAVLDLSWHFARRLVARGRGGIVLMSSLLAFQGAPRSAHYAATKAWVQTFAEGLRVELKPHGIEVVAAAPGPVASGFAARADMHMGLTVRADAVARQTLDALGRTATVWPGGLSKVLNGALAALPRWARVKVMTLVMGMMTAHRARSAPSHDRPVK